MKRSRSTWLGIALLLVSGISLGAETFVEAHPVSLAELVANRDAYDEKAVVVTGYLSLGFEKSSLCPTAKQAAGKDCVWLSFDTTPWKKLSGKRVTITGFFFQRFTGHLGCCAGSISAVIEVTAQEP